jgi:hypothetical protein
MVRLQSDSHTKRQQPAALVAPAGAEPSLPEPETPYFDEEELLRQWPLIVRAASVGGRHGGVRGPSVST